MFQYGQVQVLQWLIENTNIRDKIKCKDGERSLLHLAAKYAQEEVSNPHDVTDDVTDDVTEHKNFILRGNENHHQSMA